MLVAFTLALYVLVFAAAAASDLVRYEIPNALSLVLVAAFVPFAMGSTLGLAATHVLAGLSMLLATALCFGFGLMGGGDAKLLAAAALWMGWHNLLPFLLLTTLTGACLGMLLVVLRRLLPRAGQSGCWYGRLLSRREGVPYGVAISGAALALLPRIVAVLH
jgi:prepilin peptidase CpaA